MLLRLQSPQSATSPDTFAPATEFATCAKGTSPDTLAPATAFAVVAVVANVAKGTSLTFAPEIFVKPAPLPINDPVPLCNCNVTCVSNKITVSIKITT